MSDLTRLKTWPEVKGLIVKPYNERAVRTSPVACPDIFDRGGTSGALTYAGVE
jgi:hypothetical protein